MIQFHDPRRIAPSPHGAGNTVIGVARLPPSPPLASRWIGTRPCRTAFSTGDLLTPIARELGRRNQAFHPQRITVVCHRLSQAFGASPALAPAPWRPRLRNPGSRNPSFDLQEQRHKFALAMGVGLGKDGF